MANYDGHAAKRQRTDSEGRDRGFGQQASYYNYNNQQRGGRTPEEEKPNHILLMTILNPAYPITVDVIHTICSPSGKVLRIVIFKKNGVQAMVEFDSVDSAKRAKQSLNGADIYSGCCTLKIEYAKPTRLNVYKNDAESWDYTNPNLAVIPGICNNGLSSENVVRTTTVLNNGTEAPLNVDNITLERHSFRETFMLPKTLPSHGDTAIPLLFSYWNSILHGG